MGSAQQVELKTERFAMAFQLLLGCAFFRSESEQNSSHPCAPPSYAGIGIFAGEDAVLALAVSLLGLKRQLECGMNALTEIVHGLS
jgi:hypothetical protein